MSQFGVQKWEEAYSFIADIFLTAPTYEEGLKRFAVTACILDRLKSQKTGCSDLLLKYQQMFGRETYNTYFR